MAPYFSVLLLLMMAIGFGISMFMLNRVLGPKRRRFEPGVKYEEFECGSEPIQASHQRVSVKYYLVAILFVLFDIETVLLYPWVIAANSLGVFALVQFLIFMGLLIFALVYCWRRGALEWK
jgi:NADH-quinone oxidoreductase subunit A